jgi:hydrogenase maturation protein HypF
MNRTRTAAAPLVRHQIQLTGVVQGVGFRPWVFLQAEDLHLAGTVRNDTNGLNIEIEGPLQACSMFLQRLEKTPPPHARIRSQRHRTLRPEKARAFKILPSTAPATATGIAHQAGILPDLATCTACLKDIQNPNNRRYRHPFANCTQCGPRFTIIDQLPYDRHQTAMCDFPLCPDCCTEYESPLDRRFHAQPIACPNCGPQLALIAGDGTCIARENDALLHTETLIRTGGIVAVKGLGGFHLMCDARNEQAVQLLRDRKRRPSKPFALLCRDLAQADSLAHLSTIACGLLTSPAAPIVLVNKKANAIPAKGIAPHINQLGIMLPCTPLHHILLHDLDFPLVATSGNRSDEPICIDNNEAIRDLNDVADVFLVHDRPIRRALDDAIFRIINNRPVCLRNGRGTAPVTIPFDGISNAQLAVGSRQKNALALQRSDEWVLGPYLGQLEHPKAYQRFEHRVADFPRLYNIRPAALACDEHPDDEASAFALSRNVPTHVVQHHHAHVVSCMVENDLDQEVLGVSWDGTGYGRDGTIWGGEFLLSTRADFQRYAHLRTFPLPGGEAAVRDPKRCALGLLHEAGLAQDQLNIPNKERSILVQMLERKVNCPRTSSVGRLFDAVAALLGVCEMQTFEGEAAMRMESIIDPHDEHLSLGEDPLDWEMPIRQLIESKKSTAWLITAFHNSLAEMLLQTAIRCNVPDVVLTGGCFQNAYLTERCVERLELARFTVHTHSRVPPNDGGLALGQLAVAAHQQQRNSSCA